jgi:O-antigen/teichoic acid export membrane protein
MARHSTASFAAKVFALGCAFLYAVAAARLLGPRGYGMVVVAISVASVADTIALLGIDGLAVRETAAVVTRNSSDVLRRFVRWSAVTVLGTSVGMALLVAAISAFWQPYREVLLLGALAVPILAALHLAKGITQGTGHVIAAQVPLEIVRWLATLLLLGPFIAGVIEPSPAKIVVINIAAFGVALVVAATILTRYVARLPPSLATLPAAKPWLRDALPFLSISIFAIVGTEINTLLLGSLAGPSEAGLYQPIAKLSPLMLLANEAIDMALAPRIVRMWEERSMAELSRLIHRSAIVSTLATAAVATGILIASPLILGAFGAEFLKYRSFLYWIAAAQVANAFMGASYLLLAMTGDMKRRVRAQILTLGIQAGLGVVLVPVLGALGAVISLVAAILTWAVVHWWFAWQATGIDTSAIKLLRVRAQ